MFFKILLLSFLLSNCAFSKGYFNYSQAFDVFNFFEYLSKDLGNFQDGTYQNTWIKKHGAFSDKDKEHLKNFREIRKKYYKGPEEFDKLSVTFLKAKSVDDALKNLTKIISKEEVVKIADIFKHFKKNASYYIASSNVFIGKGDELEKKFKRAGLLKSFEEVSKFFDINKKNLPKIYFLWAPEIFDTEVSYIDNFIFIKINPLKDLSSLIDERYILDSLVTSTFKTIARPQFTSFIKTLNNSCPVEAFDVLKYVLGLMHFKKETEKKSFDPYTNHFSKKEANLLAINFHHLFESQLERKMKFSGSFSNKLDFLCSHLK